MGVQEFRAVQCAGEECKMFKVQGATQNGKWSCKVCGLEQSFVRIYARGGKAADLRVHVQKLNKQRFASEEHVKEAKLAATEAWEQVEEEPHGEIVAAPRRSGRTWDEFVDRPTARQAQEDQEDQEEDDPRYVLALPSGRGQGRRGEGGRGKKRRPPPPISGGSRSSGKRGRRRSDDDGENDDSRVQNRSKKAAAAGDEEEEEEWCNEAYGIMPRSDPSLPAAAAHAPTEAPAGPRRGGPPWLAGAAVRLPQQAGEPLREAAARSHCFDAAGAGPRPKLEAAATRAQQPAAARRGGGGAKAAAAEADDWATGCLEDGEGKWPRPVPRSSGGALAGAAAPFASARPGAAVWGSVPAAAAATGAGAAPTGGGAGGGGGGGGGEWWEDANEAPPAPPPQGSRRWPGQHSGAQPQEQLPPPNFPGQHHQQQQQHLGDARTCGAAAASSSGQPGGISAVGGGGAAAPSKWGGGGPLRWDDDEDEGVTEEEGHKGRAAGGGGGGWGNKPLWAVEGDEAPAGWGTAAAAAAFRRQQAPAPPAVVGAKGGGRGGGAGGSNRWAEFM